MIIISLENINAFLQAESQIKANELYPILEYAKIESFADGKCTIIRTSMNAWLSFKTKVTGDAETYLLDDRILKGFAAQLPEGAEIQIYAKAEKLYLKSGKQIVSHQFMDVSNFPNFPDKTIKGSPVKISASAIRSIKTAMAYTKQTQHETAFSFSALSKGGEIFGSNGNFIYLKKFETEFPDVLIGQEAAAILDSEKDYTYMENDNYFFFISDATNYGFVKTEMNRINYGPITNSGKKDSFFTIKAEDITKFCSLCLAAAKELAPFATLKGKNLSYVNEAYNINVSSDIEIGGNIPAIDFNFSTALIKKVVSVLPYKSLNFSFIVKC